jgi:hypothetical protein
LYLTVAQPAVLPPKVLTIVPVVGASFDTTWTLFVLAGPNFPAADPCPDTFTVSVTVVASAWFTVKVHVWELPNPIEKFVQVVLVMVPPLTLPAAQAGPVNPFTWKTVPYAVSQTWSISTLPKFDLSLTMSTV